MIVRILHEGQYELPAEALSRLRQMDDALMASLTSGDAQEFSVRREALMALVRSEGKVVADDLLRESDLVLPHADITLKEARRLFTELA